MSNPKELMNHIPQVGKVEWISIRPERGADVRELDAVEVNAETGLVGDRYNTKSGKRQVTLIQSEHLEAVGKILGKDKIDPAKTRRNIVVSGINLLALKEKQFQIGEVILEMTGNCHPCSKMEKNLGPGGYNAMRGHGGITARVIRGGIIRKGDEVKLISEESKN